jgi:tRNA (guanine-N7-)-methyltransferase
MYHLTILEDIPDIHADVVKEDPIKEGPIKEIPVKEELKIRTHYENLDIAQSSRIHYICFTLTENQLPDKDNLLMERIKNEEPTPPARPPRPPRIHTKNAPTPHG